MGRTHHVAFWVLLAAFGSTGCGGEGMTYPVKGKVVFKGGDVGRLKGGWVHFESSSTPKVMAGGEIQADGSFTPITLKDGKEIKGLVAGTHRVLVQLPDGISSKTIDAQYQSFAKSGLTVTIPSENDLVIEVTGPRR